MLPDVSPVGGRYIPTRTSSGGVAFALEGVVISWTVFEVHGIFDSVDEGVRPFQRDRSEGGVGTGVGPAVPEFGFCR
jgi:hypothetical protein